ncbi:hypothetical protein OUZ56_015351 [Daphnia magna]|uniref:Fatty acid hydroxylase domain-containing protein n=1 Tax=Daphnia magna TaxID=35525 RepID=A0ABR0AMK0_9CRUS|nr:hypothetical protein OUZ56_015351 [Daphnia magna]
MELKPLRGWQTGPFHFASALLFLVAVVYSRVLLIQLQQFWIASGIALQSKWEEFFHFAGEDDYYLYVWGCVLSMQIPFWGVGSIFILMDYYGWPKCVSKYKIQPGTNQPVDLSKVIQTAKVVLMNQWLLTFPLLHANYYLKKITNTMPNFLELPTFGRMLIDLVVFLIIDEIGLYYMHRLQHHPKLYASVHKKHHEWHAPIAIVFTYSTPIEYIMTIIPVNIGPMIMNPHIVTLWTWYALVHLRGIKNHSGYDFPWSLWTSAHAHDFHHMTSNSCFGKSLVLDRLHGTDKAFRVHMARKKALEHRVVQTTFRKSE